MRKLFIVLAIAVLFLSGCAATFQPPEGCSEANSIILQTTQGNPTGLDKALLMVNFAGLESGKYSAAQATAALDAIEAKLTGGISYVGLKQYIDAKYVAIGLLVLGDSIGDIVNIGKTQIISTCDRDFILAHIENQRAIVALY